MVLVGGRDGPGISFLPNSRYDIRSTSMIDRAFFFADLMCNHSDISGHDSQIQQALVGGRDGPGKWTLIHIKERNFCNFKRKCADLIRVRIMTLSRWFLAGWQGGTGIIEHGIDSIKSAVYKPPLFRSGLKCNI